MDGSTGHRGEAKKLPLQKLPWLLAASVQYRHANCSCVSDVYIKGFHPPRLPFFPFSLFPFSIHSLAFKVQPHSLLLTKNQKNTKTLALN